MPQVTGLFIYPVKSMRGVSLDSCMLKKAGFTHSRCWMVVDDHGEFISQIDRPSMASISANVRHDGLLLERDGSQPILIPNFLWNHGANVEVMVWNDTCTAIDQGDEAAVWLTTALNKTARLVYMGDKNRRPSRRGEGADSSLVAFDDRCPLHIISEESLADLNQRLEHPVSMDRFRPNIVVSGCDRPYEEDDWHSFAIAGIAFRGFACDRCAVPNTDQQTGQRDAREPLHTLASYRKKGTKTPFGILANHLGTGVICIGDAIEVLRTTPT